MFLSLVFFFSLLVFLSVERSKTCHAKRWRASTISSFKTLPMFLLFMPFPATLHPLNGKSPRTAISGAIHGVRICWG